MIRRWIAAAALLLAAAVTNAQQLPPGKWWQRPEVVQELALTSEQRDKLDEIFREAANDLIDAKGGVEKVQIALRGELDRPQIRRQEVMRLAGQLSDARAKLFEREITMLLDMQGVLNNQQWSRLRDHLDRMQERQRPMDRPGGEGRPPVVTIPRVLDVALRNVSHPYGVRDVTLTCAASTHTALTGPPGCGASTLLRLIAGHLRPTSGEIILGTRVVNDIKASRRPLLYATSEIDVPGRWSVQHALIAAVRTRTLDRQDRHREYALAAEKWELVSLLERRIDSLSSTEAARAQFARIELLRPAVVVADRWLERAALLADELYRTMRIIGATVISAPATRAELAFSDRVVVLDEGRLVQSGSAAEIFARPVSDAAAIAIGDVDVIPITVHGNVVESVIGSWAVDPPPFQGSGVALVRPADFSPPAPGEDSDFVFGVEEAGFADGRWIAKGVLSGGVTLRVELPRDTAVHKGKLLALRYDPARFTLLPRDMAPLRATVPTDVVPPLRETR